MAKIEKWPHNAMRHCFASYYRVKSQRGTQFRIWATGILRDHILKGFTINERRLKELNQAVRLIADVAERRALTGDEATALLRVVADYSRALDLLDDYCG